MSSEQWWYCYVPFDGSIHAVQPISPRTPAQWKAYRDRELVVETDNLLIFVPTGDGPFAGQILCFIMWKQ